MSDDFKDGLLAEYKRLRSTTRENKQIIADATPKLDAIQRVIDAFEWRDDLKQFNEGLDMEDQR